MRYLPGILLLAAASLCWPAEPGLVAHWSFDEGSGSVARDLSGNGHDATLSGTEWVPSPRGHALRFDARDDAARYGKPEAMNLAGDMSLALWVRTDPTVEPGKCHLLIGDTGWAVDRNFSLYLQGSGSLRFEWTDGKAVSAVLAPGSLLNNTWKHLVVVAAYGTRRAVLYCDGELVAEAKMPFPITPTGFKERLTGWFYNGYFTGELDDVRLYSRALSEAEVRELFTSTADVQVGGGRFTLSALSPQPQGVAPLTLRNFSGETRQVAVACDGGPRQEYTLAPGAAVEASAATVPLQPVWRQRSDLFVSEQARAVRAEVTVGKGPTAATQSAVLGAGLYVEPLRVTVHDPWQARLVPGHTAAIAADVALALPEAQRRAGSLDVQLVSCETGRPVLTKTVAAPAPRLPLRLDARALPWGAYDLTVSFRTRDWQAPVTVSRKAMVLPGGRQQIRVLNNLVSELLDARAGGLLGSRRLEFMNPRQGWVWFRAAGDCALRLGGDRLLTAHAGGAPAEAMRLLPAGKHVLRLSGTPTDLVVRAVPALVYNVYPSGPQIAPFGNNTWERLGRYTLPNCNMIESQQVETPEARQWLSEGKLWIGNVQAPGLIDKNDWTVEKMLEVWLNPGKPTAWEEKQGFTLDRLSGVQVDEYYPGALSGPNVLRTALSIGRAADDPAYAGKLWIPFAVSMYGDPAAELLMKTTLGSGWPFSVEVYEPERATEAEDLASLRARFQSVAAAWEQAYPGCMRRAIFTPMYAYLPYCTTNCYPGADFRVHLDLQLQLLASDPALFGLWGIQPYRSNYVDEEILNCTGLLLRHYCLEGRTDRMLDDPYELRHVGDPDFGEGTTRWQVQAAEDGGVNPGSFKGYGELQGRYPVGTMGDTFVVLRRSARGPNVVSQELKGLRPGRLYSVKVYSGDYADLTGGRSRKDLQALGLGVEGAQVQPGGFSYPFRSARGPQPFTRDAPFWMTYHWLRFRATGPTATLRISDWARPGEAGGPIGQQTMVNFVEVQPVFEPPAR